MRTPKNAPGENPRLIDRMRANPRNLTAVLTLPYVAYEVASEMRWRRSHGLRTMSLEGSLAYIKARPARFAVSLLVSLAPEIIGALAKARTDKAATDSGSAKN